MSMLCSPSIMFIVLDAEGKVQYYRSVRGTLEPLLTEPARKAFPFPSGRAQYQQHQLLREELQKHLGRRQDIDNFFNNLFNHKTEGAKAPAQDPSITGRAAPPADPMKMLLQMRQKGPGKASRRTSFQQLAACQYLRLNDWGADEKTDPTHEPVATSWATAENRLKAGFLALHFNGHR
ncbi:hypothetical protein ACOMHN_008185 [Nucella lapillus]